MSRIAGLLVAAVFLFAPTHVFAQTEKYVYLQGTNAVTGDSMLPGGAQWQSDVDGVWRNSGDSESHPNGAPIWLSFKAINGFYTPTNRQVSWDSNPLTVYYYQWTNSFSVTVSPETMVWTLTGPTNFTYFNFGTRTGSVTDVLCPTGTYVVQYTARDCYSPSPSVETQVIAGAASGVFSSTANPFTNSIRVVIEFDGSSATVVWNITSYPELFTNSSAYRGAYINNVTVSPIPVGAYTIQFPALSNYTPTAWQTNVLVYDDFNPVVTARYTRIPPRRLTVHVVLPGETNFSGVGTGLVSLAPLGVPATNDTETFFYETDESVTLTAVPTNIIVNGVTYKSFFFEWFGRRWSGSAWQNDLCGYNNPYSGNPITLTMDYDRQVTVLFSREKYPWDNVGDLDSDGLPDEWERYYGLNPKDDGSGYMINGPAGNADGDWIPSTSTNPPALITIVSNLTTYNGANGSIPGYPLLRDRLLRQQRYGTGDRLGYAGGVPFNNLLECRGFDGFYKTNGGAFLSGTNWTSYWTPNDDPESDPAKADTDGDTLTDGWEYYFWYWRSAEAYARGLTNTSANLSWVTLHPTRANPDYWDTDGDEFTDIEEYSFGTDPTHADTDGDGMDDWWEYDNGLAYLDYIDWRENLDNDYYAVRTNYMILTNGTVGTAFAQPVICAGVLGGTINAAWVEGNGDTNFAVYWDKLLVGRGAVSNGMNGAVVAQQVFYGMSAGLSAYCDGYPVWVDMDGSGTYSSGDVALINPFVTHNEVYCSPPPEPYPAVTMFNPLTAWFGAGVSGGTTAFESVNSASYDNYQEYLGGDHLGRISWDAAGRRSVIHDSPVSPGRASATNPNAEDSDSDGIPDGWELFVGMDPWDDGDALGDPDKDGLRNIDEWANATHALSNCGNSWSNKFWPTDPGVVVAPAPNDPHPKDTDWDGLTDGGERAPNINPASYDTDGDFLPDGWELYAGANPLVSDAQVDYDGDGLLNWREYWTGTVPEWMGCDALWDLKFISRRAMTWDPRWSGENILQQFFLPPDFASCPSFLYQNGIITDLAELRANFPAAWVLGDGPDNVNYHTTLANDADSDTDQMDDYWEVYHGLNPLSGGRNILYPATHSLRDDTATWWTFYVDAYPASVRYDFGYYSGLSLVPFANAGDYFTYIFAGTNAYNDSMRVSQVAYLVGPQNFGLPLMDADGDGLANLDEYAYSVDRAFQHTDPTPLWRTDSRSDTSFVSLNYGFDRWGGLPEPWGGGGGFRLLFPYSFEEAEGFDTDNDGVGDYHEVNAAAGSYASNPLDSRNPARNRALYLDGTSFARTLSSWSAMSESFLTRFCVEAWVRPTSPYQPIQQVILDKAGEYTDPFSFSELPRSNFQLGLTNGLPYVRYNGRGSFRIYQATANPRHRVAADTWTHVAGVYDGTWLTLYVNGEESASLRTTELPVNGTEMVAYGPTTNTYYGVDHSVSVGASDLQPSREVPSSGISPTNCFIGYIDEVRVWDGARARGDILANMTRRLSTNDMNNSAISFYWTFDDVPDPDIETIVPDDLAALDTRLAMHQRISWWYDFPLRSLIYTGSSPQGYNYIVTAEDHVSHRPVQPPLDDYYHFSTNYLGSNSPSPAGYLNPYNPYGMLSIGGSVILSDFVLMRYACARAFSPSWLGSLDPNNPDAADSDGDGLPDWWENMYGLDPYDASGNSGRWGDPDGDGLSNWAEYKAGTNPHLWDTDGDGRSDYDSRSSTDPFALTWGELYDDGDGMPDLWESQYGLDPHHYDAHLDKDSDGWSNYAEYLAGTDPSNAYDFPQPSVSGVVRYDGQKTGMLVFHAYQTNTMDGAPAIVKVGTDSLVADVVGHTDGTRTFTGRLPFYPIDNSTVVKITAPLPPDTNGIVRFITFTFTDPYEFDYSGSGVDYDANLNYATGRFTLWFASAEVPARGAEVSVSYSFANRNAAAFRIEGLKEGEVYIAAFLDSGSRAFEVGEPFGVLEGQPLNLSVASLGGGEIFLTDTGENYNRFEWTMPSTITSRVELLIDRTSENTSPDYVHRWMYYPRNYFMEWDYKLAGHYGLPAGTYRWWVGDERRIFERSGTFAVNWTLPERAYAVSPRGDTFYDAALPFAWTMGTNATMYHIQIARQNANGSLTVVEDGYYPAPARRSDGIYRAYLSRYASEFGNGVYYWRVAGWNPAGQGPWSGDDPNSVQTFTINLDTSYSRTIKGTIYYYGKIATDTIVVEAYGNSSFSGSPVARVRVSIPRSSNPNKTVDYTLAGLPAGTYYVRAYVDTVPAAGTAAGAFKFWSTYGFVRDPNDFYAPAALSVVNTTLLIDQKIVLRDRDTDNDELPDAWEIQYFGNLDQTGDMDYDGDGETNLDEYRYSGGILNPTARDSDGDGLSDAFEQKYNGARYGYTATRGVLNPTAWDTDGDGYSDGAELRRYKTNPLDAGSYPAYRPSCYGPSASPLDFDADGRTDAAIFDPASGTWYGYTMSGWFGQAAFGTGAMTPLAGDYDGDGCNDLALYHQAEGRWYVYTMSGLSGSLQFGDANMLPVPADYSGDMRTDLGVFDRVSGTWYLYELTSGQFISIRHGGATQVPVPADYDGDGCADLAVYDPANGAWSIRTWLGFAANIQWGGPMQVPVPADYDGDGRADLAVFNTATGLWRVWTSSGRVLEGTFGWYGVIPVPGDYDGDGRSDAAFYDPPSGMWYIYTMSGRMLRGQFGWPGAIPVLGRR